MSEINCNSGFYPVKHQEQRPAVTVVNYPSGMQEPACADCVRYWLSRGPAQLSPLRDYADPQVAAQAQLDERLTLDALQSAYLACSEDVVRRIASGAPLAADWEQVDRLMGLTAEEASQRMSDGTYRQMAGQVASAARSGHPAPMQDMAWAAMRERRLPLQAPDAPAAEDEAYRRAYGAAGPVRDARPQWSQAKKRGILAGTCAVLFALGGWLASIPPTDGNLGTIFLGVLLIGAGLAVPVIALIAAVLKDASRTHRSWLDGKPPSEQARIKQAEQAAVFVATSAAAVALHKHNKRGNARMAASAMGTGPHPGQTEAAFKQQQKRYGGK